MKPSIIRSRAVAVLAASQAVPGLEHPAAIPQDGSSHEGMSPSKKELLKRMERLEAKLPPELARKLIVLSMKTATGWCSPYAAREFEDEIEKLPAGVRKKFEKEWKLVREHEAWPRLPPPKKAASASRLV